MKTRTITGTLLTLAGVACYAAASVMLLQTLDQQASDGARIERANKSCLDQLIRLGRVTPEENNVIELEITDSNDPTGLKDPRAAMGDATAALAMCPGRNILEACIGTTCGTATPGPIRMTLRMGLVK